VIAASRSPCPLCRRGPVPQAGLRPERSAGRMPAPGAQRPSAAMRKPRGGCAASPAPIRPRGPAGRLPALPGACRAGQGRPTLPDSTSLHPGYPPGLRRALVAAAAPSRRPAFARSAAQGECRHRARSARPRRPASRGGVRCTRGGIHGATRPGGARALVARMQAKPESGIPVPGTARRDPPADPLALTRTAVAHTDAVGSKSVGDLRRPTPRPCATVRPLSHRDSPTPSP
jgi:hypothetical protein